MGMRHNFQTFSDHALVSWLGQYSGPQAGYYPGIRRTRLAAEREAAIRGLAWWRGFTTAPCATRGTQRAFDPRLIR